MDTKERLIAMREKTGLNRKEFAEKFGIPYQTITCWELGKREMPEYVLRLIAYRIEMDPLLKKGEQDS
jgi:DNA-binding transcriptional regulator YiaG